MTDVAYDTPLSADNSARPQRGALIGKLTHVLIVALPGLALLVFWQWASGRLIREIYVSKPTAIYHPGPKYSEKALFKHVSGTVRVRLVVNEKGFPEILEATRHLGEGLDMHALSAVAQWRFEPARKNGQPVAVMVVVEINFRIRRRGERSNP